MTTNAVVLVLIFIATRLNRNIGYANGPHCDTWYFFGVYNDYFQLRSSLGGQYQLNRFPAILPWILIGPHMSAVALTELKFWTYLLISSTCFSYSAIKLFGGKSGSLISIMLACSTLFLAPLSTDFVTAAGLAWQSAFVAVSVKAGMSSRRTLWLLLAGMFGAFCIYSHIPMAMFVFSTPLYLFLRAPRPSAKELAWSIVLMGSGFVGTTIAFCVVSVLLGGGFVFFGNELRAAIIYVQTAFYARPMTNAQWFSFDANVPIFLLAAGSAIAVLTRLCLQRSLPKFPNLALPAVIYLAAFILCFGFEFSGRMLLQDGFFAPWLYQPAFLAIGSALSLAGLPRKALSSAIFVIVAFVLVWTASHPSPGIDYKWRYLLAMGAFVFLVLPVGSVSSLFSIACMLALLAVDYPTGPGYFVWDRAKWNGPALYQVVQRADRFIATNAGNSSRPDFWVSGDIDRPDDLLFASIAGARSLLRCSDFAASYPSIKVSPRDWNPSYPDLPTALRDHYISKGHRLFIIARGRDLIASAMSAFRSVGLTAKPLGETEIAPGISIAVAEIR